MDTLYRLSEWLNQAPMLNMAFLGLAAVSIVVSVVLFVMGRKVHRPCYTIRTFRLVQDTLTRNKSVEIRYNHEAVSSLSLTRLAIWNQGADPIEPHDIAAKDPFRISFAPDVQLLGAEITKISTPAINVGIDNDIDHSSITITFDYLAKRDGFVLEIYHTGSSNDEVILSGTVKGVKHLRHVASDGEPITDYWFSLLFGWLPSKPENRALRYTYIILIVGIFLIIAPILIFSLLLDRLVLFIRRTPGQLSIRDTET